MKTTERLATRLLLLFVCLPGCGENTPTSPEFADDIVVSSETDSSGRYLFDWPQLYGPNGDCVVATPAPAMGDVESWMPTWTISAGTGYSAPVGDGGSVFLWDRIEDQVRLRRIDVSNGEVIWSREFQTQFECDYSQYSSGPYSTPLIDDSMVYCISPEGILRALTFLTGELVWECNLTQQFDVPIYGYPVGHSPISGFGLEVVVNVGGREASSCLVAFDNDTGEVAWQAGDHLDERIHGSHGSPVQVDVEHGVYNVAVTSDSILCVRAGDEQVHAQMEFGTGSADTPNAATPVVMGDRILVSGFRADVVCLRIKPEGGFEEVWSNRRSIESSYSPLTYFDGVVYGWHAFDRSLRCVNADTGTLLWKKKTVFGRGNHVLFEGFIGTQMIALGEDGHVGVLDVSPESCEILTVTEKPAIPGPCYTMPAWISGRLLIRNESELRCYDLAK